jgi:carotenoid 1,2-hydratase
VFSPYYKASGRGNPLDNCSINVALTGPRGNRWAMTERGEASVARDAASFSVGPSAVRWDGNALIIDIDERCALMPFDVKGRVRVTPQVMGTTAFDLGRGHMWHPISPRARVEADFGAPGVRWSGNGYFDSNQGSEPLEDGFRDWQWSRAHVGPAKEQTVGVVYEGVRRDGSDFAMALRCDKTGHWADEPLPPRQRLMPTPFAIGRSTRADVGYRARVVKTWLDAPFYARSALRTKMFGHEGEGVHESLSLDRLIMPIVQGMLPYRMPRKP